MQLMLKVVMGILAASLVAAACFTTIALHWTGSDGQRAGYVQKPAHRGWLCKTWEGEMSMLTMPGKVGDKFRFTVGGDAVAATLNASVGQHMALHYEQHKLIPSSCFGETEYFVTDARRITE
jgi:hypothetical protein